MFLSLLPQIFTGILLRGATNSSNPHGPDWTIDCFLIELFMIKATQRNQIQKQQEGQQNT